MSSQPSHPGDKGRAGRLRVLPGHREQEVSERTQPRVRIPGQDSGPVEEGGWVSRQQPVSDQ